MKCTYNLGEYFLVQDVQCDVDKIYVIAEKCFGIAFYAIIDLRSRKITRRACVGEMYFGKEHYNDSYTFSKPCDVRIGKAAFDVTFDNGNMEIIPREEGDEAMYKHPGYNVFSYQGEWCYRDSDGSARKIQDNEEILELGKKNSYYSGDNYVCYFSHEHGNFKIVVVT